MSKPSDDEGPISDQLDDFDQAYNWFAQQYSRIRRSAGSGPDDPKTPLEPLLNEKEASAFTSFLDNFLEDTEHEHANSELLWLDHDSHNQQADRTEAGAGPPRPPPQQSPQPQPQLQQDPQKPQSAAKSGAPGHQLPALRFVDSLKNDFYKGFVNSLQQHDSVQSPAAVTVSPPVQRIPTGHTPDYESIPARRRYSTSPAIIHSSEPNINHIQFHSSLGERPQPKSRTMSMHDYQSPALRAGRTLEQPTLHPPRGRIPESLQYSKPETVSYPQPEQKHSSTEVLVPPPVPPPPPPPPDNTSPVRRPVETEARPEPSVKKREEYLSEDQVRLNHIHSEKRRRDLIKQLFTELSNLVPSIANATEQQAKSVILNRVYEYMLQVNQQNHQLRKALQQRKVQVPDGYCLDEVSGETRVRSPG